MEQMKTLTLGGNSYEIVDDYARAAIRAIQSGGSSDAPVSPNFCVVAYSTEEQLMQSAPAGNTIGVVTETPITKSVLSPQEPPSPAEGQVWLAVSYSNGRNMINTLRAAGLEFGGVNALSAKQYTGGAWVGVIAKSYLNNEWTDWTPYLYALGDHCTSFTGGWSEAKEANGVIVWNPDHVNLTYTGSGGRGGRIWTTNAIDLSDFNTLKIRTDAITVNSSSYGFAFGVIGSPYLTNSNVAGFCSACSSYCRFTASAVAQTVSIDISDVNGAQYIELYWGVASTKVYEIWLE